MRVLFGEIGIYLHSMLADILRDQTVDVNSGYVQCVAVMVTV